MPIFLDNAEPVLSAHHELSDEHEDPSKSRAHLWDEFHRAPHASALSASLDKLNLSPDFKAELIAAKRKPAVEYDVVEKIQNAIQQIGRMEPRTLDWAEQNVEKFMAMLGN